MKNQTILMLGYSDWDHWRPTHEFARIFSKENLVIFVEPFLGYGDLRWKGLSRVECLKRIQFKPLHRISKNLFVVQPPPGLPSSISILSRFWDKEVRYFSNHFGKILQAKWLKAYLRSQGIVPTVLFLSHPTDLHLAGRFGERISCWRVYDELALGYSNKAYSEIQTEIEIKYSCRVNLIFASSRKQYEKRRILHPNVFYISNSVNFAQFNIAMKSKASEPDDLSPIPRPRIGYIGNIENVRLDYNLLEETAKIHPEWSLVLIGWISGGAQEKVKSLTQLQNVYVLPYKPHAKIPIYLKGFDVGLIPFKVTPFSNAMNPLKLYEYLAVGLPVVSTMLDELKCYSKTISISLNVDDFVFLIEKALQDNSPDKILNRISFAQQNSWDQRVEEMSRILDEGLH